MEYQIIAGIESDKLKHVLSIVSLIVEHVCCIIGSDIADTLAKINYTS